MSIKKIFGRRSKSSEPEPLDADDLIVLKRYDEAEKLLKQKIRRSSKDLQARRKLADLYRRTRRVKLAVDEYLSIVDRYAADGFYDKAVALMSKALKLAPEEHKLQLKMQRLQRMRRSEQRLSAVMRSLSRTEGQVGTTATSSYLELQNIWGELSVSHLMDHLDDNQLACLLKAMKLARIGRNQVLVEMGQRLEEIYLVTQGRIEALVELPGGETTVIRSCEPGDLLGDRALLEHQPWPATFKTTESTVLLKVDRGGLEKALQGNPDPKGLLQALRDQKLDAEIADKVRRTLGN